MKVEVDFKKKYVLLILGIFVLFGVYAYNSGLSPSIFGHVAADVGGEGSIYDDPSIFGHTIDEIEGFPVCEEEGNDLNPNFVYDGDFNDGRSPTTGTLNDMSNPYIGKVAVYNRPYEDRTGAYTESYWSKNFITSDPSAVHYFRWNFDERRGFYSPTVELLDAIFAWRYHEIVLPLERETGELITLLFDSSVHRDKKEYFKYSVTHLGEGEYKIDFLQRVWGNDDDEGGILMVKVDGIHIEAPSFRV